MGKRTLTLNACTTCRQKRTKCDGKSPCARCKARKEECSYESREWQTKEHLRSELRKTLRHGREADSILAALREGGDRRASILERLGSGESISSIAKDQAATADNDSGLSSSGPSSPAASSSRGPTTSLSTPSSPRLSLLSPLGWPPRPADDSVGGGGTSTTGSIGGGSIGGGSFGTGSSTRQPLLSSTLLAAQQRQQQLMIDLFFAWEPAPFSLVTERLFRRDYLASGRTYCSAALVNAILALAERYLDSPPPSSWLGDSLAQEARTSLDDDSYSHSLAAAATTTTSTAGPASSSSSSSSSTTTTTTITTAHLSSTTRLTRDLPAVQALGLLAMREMCRARHGPASRLVQEALERIQLADGETDADARLAWHTTISGLIALTRTIFMVTQIDLAVSEALQRVISIQSRIMLPEKPIEPLSNFVVSMSEKVYSLLNTTLSRRRLDESNRDQQLEKPPPAELDAVYETCLALYAAAAESLRESDGRPAHVLFAHIYYHALLYLLFRPFVRYAASTSTSTSSTSIVTIRPPAQTMMSEACAAVSALAKSYLGLFGSQCVPALLPSLLSVTGQSLESFASLDSLVVGD